MKNELEMKLFSRRSLTDLIARQQITALSDFGGGLMRPDKCSEVDPIRTRLTLPTSASQLSGWHNRSANFFIKRVVPFM